MIIDSFNKLVARKEQDLSLFLEDFGLHMPRFASLGNLIEVEKTILLTFLTSMGIYIFLQHSDQPLADQLAHLPAFNFIIFSIFSFVLINYIATFGSRNGIEVELELRRNRIEEE